jgi:hypothetical protein
LQVELTEYGRDLEPIVLALGRWGSRSMGEPRLILKGNLKLLERFTELFRIADARFGLSSRPTLHV